MRRFTTFRFLYTFISFLIIVTGTWIVIRFAQGYRVDKSGDLKTTGLFVANSFPIGAEVVINGRLTTATDTTLNLEPKEYDIEIRKDGYSPWQKRLQIQEGLVTQTNAQLYRRVPSLTPLTFYGVGNISPSPDGQKVVYYTASATTPSRNGLYLLDLGSGILSGFKEAKQISNDVTDMGLESAEFIWSPDSSQVLLQSKSKEMLLDIGRMSDLSTLPDVSLTKIELLSSWRDEIKTREKQYLEKFPLELIEIARQSAENVYLSPDKKRLFYTATAPATLPLNLSPGLPSANNQPEERVLKPGVSYIYDREEDRNFALNVPLLVEDRPSKLLISGVQLDTLVGLNNLNEVGNPGTLGSPLVTTMPRASLSASPKVTASASPTVGLSNLDKLDTDPNEPRSLTRGSDFLSYHSALYTNGVQWMPDSKHLLFSQDDKIFIKEYDNTNQTIVYSGPFANSFVYPWPDGSNLVILASFSANSPLNLYAVEIK